MLFVITNCSAFFRVSGLKTKVKVKKSQTTIDASLRNITVSDADEEALYPEILTFEKGDVFNLAVVSYNDSTSGDNYDDMSNVDVSFQLKTGSMCIVFLNAYVHNVMVSPPL